jgi:protein-S-isoprenylcysteine O-methyltransferase Ste14
VEPLASGGHPPLRSLTRTATVLAMGALLFRHRLAVILGFFGVAVAVVIIVARGAEAEGISTTIGPRSPLFLPSGVGCLLAFGLRAWGEARVGAAVYGQRASSRLVTSGPFAVVRHPLYVGTWLFFAASTAPYLPPAVAAVLGLAFAVVLRTIAVFEEGELERVHGDGWRRYAGAVPRFVGLPRAGLDADGVVVTVRDWGLACLSNVGMLAIGGYRVVVGAGAGFRGLPTLTLVAVMLWLVVVVVRRFRRP